MNQHNRAQYLAWLRGVAPALYRDCVPQIGVSQVGEYTTLDGFWDSVGTTFNSVITNVSNSLPQIASTYSQYREQRDLIKLNTQRATQGEAPLRYQDGRLITASGLPYTPEEYSLAGRGNLMTVGLIGGFAVIALLLLRPSRR